MYQYQLLCHIQTLSSVEMAGRLRKKRERQRKRVKDMLNMRGVVYFYLLQRW